MSSSSAAVFLPSQMPRECPRDKIALFTHGAAIELCPQPQGANIPEQTQLFTPAGFF